MKQVLILQGLPGSGKTMYAERFTTANSATKTVVVSADHYFTNTNGEYQFHGGDLPKAHGQCLKNFVTCLNEPVPVVIVDNTNLTVAEIAPYYALAQAYDYEVRIYRFPCPPEVAAARNKHSVPPEQIDLMAKKLEKFDPPLLWVIEEVNVCFKCKGFMDPGYVEELREFARKVGKPVGSTRPVARLCEDCLWKALLVFEKDPV